MRLARSPHVALPVLQPSTKTILCLAGTTSYVARQLGTDMERLGGGVHYEEVSRQLQVEQQRVLSLLDLSTEMAGRLLAQEEQKQELAAAIASGNLEDLSNVSKSSAEPPVPHTPVASAAGGTLPPREQHVAVPAPVEAKEDSTPVVGLEDLGISTSLGPEASQTRSVAQNATESPGAAGFMKSYVDTCSELVGQQLKSHWAPSARNWPDFRLQLYRDAFDALCAGARADHQSSGSTPTSGRGVLQHAAGGTGGGTTLEKAMELLPRMRSEGLVPDTEIFSTLVGSAFSSHDSERLAKVLATAEEYGVSADDLIASQ